MVANAMTAFARAGQHRGDLFRRQGVGMWGPRDGVWITGGCGQRPPRLLAEADSCSEFEAKARDGLRRGHESRAGRLRRGESLPAAGRGQVSRRRHRARAGHRGSASPIGFQAAEAVHSEIAEEQAEYRVVADSPDSIDQVPIGSECGCGWVYSSEHHFCSRCGAVLKPSIVPKAIPGRLQFERRIGKGGAGVVYDASGHNRDYGFGRINAASAV